MTPAASQTQPLVLKGAKQVILMPVCGFTKALEG